MTMTKVRFKQFAVLLTVAVSMAFSTKSFSQSKATIASLQKQIKELTAKSDLVQKRLIAFDTLDFKVFSNQEWTRLHETHAKDIKVYWPDGHLAVGIEQHIKDLAALFVYAPDTRIKEHPIRFGSGNYTAVTGIMKGTFTKPMTTADGKVIQPTGKSFELPMATIGVWKDGVMIEEYLYFDYQTYMNQLGVVK